MQAIVFEVGSERYAVASKSVRQVIGTPRLAVLPLAPKGVLGLVNVGGEISPAYDAAYLLGLPSVSAPYLLMLETSAGVAGLTVSGVPRAAELTPTADGGYAWQEQALKLFDIEQVLVSPWSK